MVTSSSRPKVPLLSKLALMYGVQTAYYDVDKRRQTASPEALLLVLRAMGAPVETFGDVQDALRECLISKARLPVEPVAVAWDGKPTEVELRLPADVSPKEVTCALGLEDGDTRPVKVELSRGAPRQVVEVEGETYTTHRLTTPRELPWGYHRLKIGVNDKSYESTIVSAPKRAYGDASTGAFWGCFLPLYALHSKRSWGAGDFTDLEALMDGIARQGGGVVGTLPLLASFLSEPLDPSPYNPASRLMWNELYIDVTRAPELEACPEARALVSSAEVQRELDELRSSQTVDYPRITALKRRVLELLARSFFARDSERLSRLKSFVEAHPLLAEYARFRAVGEQRRAPWSLWPEPLKSGSITQGEYDKEVECYYLYTQWLAHEQILSLATKARDGAQGLYLDFPLGVHPEGFDTWREQYTFAFGTSVGAPPDTFFTKGQNWGFPPLSPHKLRAQGYRYIIDCLRHHLRAAGILRIDHVMALHRLFWVPTGLEAAHGVYVRYNAEELYAILSLESHRHKSWIVGENLGTVPHYVNPTMNRHNIRQMYVLQYELNSNRKKPVSTIGADVVASMNTHDMPTFSGYWEGLDVEDRMDLGLLSQKAARREKKQRESIKEALVEYLDERGLMAAGPVTAEGALRACLSHLLRSPARVVLVNLEDLWLETKPQNVPGTFRERPNWRRKAAYSLEAFWELPQVRETFKELNRLRRQG